MHLNILCCQQTVCCFSVKNMGASLHYVRSFVKLYMELVYPIIDYCSVCSSGAASSKSHGLFDLHLQKSQLGEFPHIGLIANISSMHNAGHQAALYIQVSTSIEVINNNLKPCWLQVNESKYLCNVLMCPFVLHAVNSIVASH